MAVAVVRVLLAVLTLILAPGLLLWLEKGNFSDSLYSETVVLESPQQTAKPAGFLLSPDDPAVNNNRSKYRWNPIKESETAAYYAYRKRMRTTTAAPILDTSLPVNCTRLTQQNKTEVARVGLKMKQERWRYHIPTDSDIVNYTSDCDSYLRDKGYILQTLSQEEADFPLAFAIRMHYNTAQVERLLRAIYRPQNVYCISIDKRSPTSIFQAMYAIAKCFPNVFVLTSLNEFVYQGFSPVESDLDCMQATLKRNSKWKYFLNMAGMEFPLKTNLEIVRVLKSLNGSNDIEQYPFAKYNLDRVTWKHTLQGSTWQPTTTPKEPFTGGNITVLKGCSYNSFTRGFVQWVLTDQVAQHFINWTRDLHSPDEVVWASLNAYPGVPGGYNSMVTQTAKTFLAREIIWHNSAGYCFGQNMIRGVCILSIGNLHWLLRRWEIIANKFDIRYDHIAVDCMEELLNQRTIHPEPDKYIHWVGVWRALDAHKTLEFSNPNNVHSYNLLMSRT